MVPAKEAGEFRAKIISYGTRESQKAGSESMAMSVTCLLTHRKVGNDWEEITDGVFSAEGDIYFIRANGKEDSTRVEALMQATGWDGEITTLDKVDPVTYLPIPEEKCWAPNPVIVRIKADDYLVKKGVGELRYKVDQILPDGAAPRVVTEAGARRRAEKARLARDRAMGKAPPAPSPGEFPPIDEQGDSPF